MSTERDLLEVDEVADGCWRICDATAARDDASRILACAQVMADGVHVTWLCPGAQRERYPSLADLLATCRAFVQTHDSERRRPVPIPHFAPPMADRWEA